MTTDYHLKQYRAANPELVDLILRSIYVDDIVAGARDVDTARRFHEESRRVLRDGGFNLRKFMTNVPELFEDQEQPSQQSSPTPATKCCVV